MRLIVDGHETYVYTGTKAWNPAQPTMLFIHGAANDHSVWALQSRYFAHHGWNVIAPDLPGHGLSAGVPLGSIEGIAAWLEMLLHPLALGDRGRGEGGIDSKVPDGANTLSPNPSPPGGGGRSLAVVGHSMGSLVALALAAKLEARCTHLALLGTAAPMAVSDALLDAAQNEPDRAYRMVNQFALAASSHIGGNKSPGMSMAGMGLALMRRAKPGVLHRDFQNCAEFADAGLALSPKVRGRVLVLSGARDLMTPAKTVAPLIAALKANPSVTLTTETIAGCGHGMMSEAPEAVLAALKGLLK